MFATRTEREYGVRHLRPGNLSELRRELAAQLGALRKVASRLSSAKRFGQLHPVRGQTRQTM
jgi:hypothetical protein